MEKENDVFLLAKQCFQSISDKVHGVNFETTPEFYHVKRLIENAYITRALITSGGIFLPIT